MMHIYEARLITFVQGYAACLDQLGLSSSVPPLVNGDVG